MKRDLLQDDDRLVTRLRAILDGKDAPETRIGQALAMLEQEAETGEIRAVPPRFRVVSAR